MTPLGAEVIEPWANYNYSRSLLFSFAIPFTHTGVLATYPLTECKPAGLALGPQRHLAVGCSGDAIDDGAHAQTIIIDDTDGHVVATITEVGGSDEVWYNPGDNRYYTASRSMTSNGMKDGKPTPVVGVIDAGTNKWITNIPSGKNAHSVAVDGTFGIVYSPFTAPSATGGGAAYPNGGINIFSTQ